VLEQRRVSALQPQLYQSEACICACLLGEGERGEEREKVREKDCLCVVCVCEGASEKARGR